MSAKPLPFEEAAELLLSYQQAAFGGSAYPNRNLSEVDPTTKRWIMRNVNGFLGFVASNGKAWSYYRSAA